jgi:hypothetical protein
MSVIIAKDVCAKHISSLPSYEQLSVIRAKNVCENITSLPSYEHMSAILAKNFCQISLPTFNQMSVILAKNVCQNQLASLQANASHSEQKEYAYL